MFSPLNDNERLLLIDTCGETAGVALSCGQDLMVAESLIRGSASAEIIQAISRSLRHQGWQLRDLDAIGVVHGPGSFTGTRSGLATAKGLCVATGLPLAPVSRLEVLADVAALTEGYVALDAGRGEVYLRDLLTAREWLSAASDARTLCQGQKIAVAETRLLDAFEGCETMLSTLRPPDSLSAVLRRLREGGSDVAHTDANYVREERDIYRKSPRPAVA